MTNTRFNEPNWQALEATVAVSRGRLDCGDFMYMGETDAPSGVTVYLYKHCDTRRYINLDSGGHAYRYCGDDGYRPLGSLTEAINHLLS